MVLGRDGLAFTFGRSCSLATRGWEELIARLCEMLWLIFANTASYLESSSGGRRVGHALKTTTLASRVNMCSTTITTGQPH